MPENIINTIGIIGSGTMGSGIASVSALSGCKTIVYDINEEALARAHKNILKGYDKLAEKGKLDDAKKNSAISNLIFTRDFNRLSICDIVIEAALENLELKRELYKQLDEITFPGCILATNTSSFSVTAISSVVKDKSRVIGMHFFNPANIMKLVEIIKGEFTSDETLDKVVSVTNKLGKTPVICKDTPAFIINRVARPFYGEALKILSEGGITVDVIDGIMKHEGGFAMGPFELMDLIGIDVNFSVTKSVYEAFFYDQKYKPSPIQQKMVEAGLLGRKTGQGFYKYP
jgi:3-hydroxybutyryl-CoA dehydrogenase